MAGYIYLPIPAADLLDFAAEWRAGQERKGKNPYPLLYHNIVGGAAKVFVRKMGFGLLRNLQPADKLYVLMHGASNGPLVIADKKLKRDPDSVKAMPRYIGGVQHQYTAHELALILRDEGLPRSFQDLRIFACYSGAYRGNLPFGLLLREEMRLLRYGHLRVIGYIGETSGEFRKRTSPDDNRKETTGEYKGVTIAGGSYPASTRRVYFPTPNVMPPMPRKP
jgi:hypothetical protein